MSNTTMSHPDHMLDHYVEYYRPLKAFQKLCTFTITINKAHLVTSKLLFYLPTREIWLWVWIYNHNITFSTHITCDQGEFGEK